MLPSGRTERTPSRTQREPIAPRDHRSTRPSGRCHGGPEPHPRDRGADRRGGRTFPIERRHRGRRDAGSILRIRDNGIRRADPDPIRRCPQRAHVVGRGVRRPVARAAGIAVDRAIVPAVRIVSPEREPNRGRWSDADAGTDRVGPTAGRVDPAAHGPPDPGTDRPPDPRTHAAPHAASDAASDPDTDRGADASAHADAGRRRRAQAAAPVSGR